MIRVAIIGASGYAATYYRLLEEDCVNTQMRVYAAVIRDPVKDFKIYQQLKSKGCLIFRSYQELIAQTANHLDLCILPTPPHFHSEQACIALKHGVNVLIEKPLATSSIDARRIISASKSNELLVAVGYQYMYAGETMQIKRVINSGRLGHIKKIVIIGMWPRSTCYYKRNTWAGRTMCGNTIVNDSPASNAFSHMITLALFWAGKEESECATPLAIKANTYTAQEISTFDTVCAEVAVGNGTAIMFYLSHSTEAQHTVSIDIECEKGAVMWRHNEGCSITRNGESPNLLPITPTAICRELVMQAVIAKIAGRDVFYCSGNMAAEHVKLIEMMTKESSHWRFRTTRLSRQKRNGKEYITVRGLDNCLQMAALLNCSIHDVDPYIIN